MRLSRVRSTTARLATIAVLAGMVASPANAAAQPDPAPVAPELAAQVERADTGDRVQALLMLPNATDLHGDHDTVIDTLRDHAADSQADVIRRITARKDVTVVNRLWLTNMLVVEFPARTDALGALAATPGVDRLIPNFEMTLPDVTESQDVRAQAVTWGLDKIEAPRVWDDLGVTGEGAKVAVLDTGVAIDHPDLAGKMATANPRDPRHPGGWAEFDSTGRRVDSTPRDSSVHGTHVTGTVVGGDNSGTAIGVAPAAEFMHGLIIPNGRGSFAQVAAGMQWAVAPTDINGDAAGSPPDVVSMSLGSNGFLTEMIAPTRAIRAAGIVPIIAIGNNCGTAGTASPGNVYEAIAVGATDASDNVASFSCGGVVRKDQWADPPAEWPDEWVKPNISAPGVDVYSADPGGGYATLSGTSMATPHTAGTAALMRSAAPDLSVDDVFAALADTSFWDDRNSPDRPDTRFGHGRINAYEATAQVVVGSGITGTVTAAGSGEPIGGATVVISSPDKRTLTTDENGTFSTRLEPGTYDLAVTVFGYADAIVSDVVITENSFTPVAVPLQNVPSGQVTGTVVYDESGDGVPGATVSVLDVPRNLSATTDADGRYTLPLVPEGSYSVEVSHPSFTAPEPSQVTVTAGDVTTVDFTVTQRPPSVAVVSSPVSYAQEFVDDVFEPAGVPATAYSYGELEKAAKHPVVLVGYNSGSTYDQARFQAFLDATDASGAGVLFLDHPTGSLNGLSRLSRHTGQPEGIWSTAGWTDGEDLRYEVTVAHPIFGDREVGDHVMLAPADSDIPKWAAWFAGYEGDGRQIIGTLGRNSGVLGGGVAIDQRANNRHVLLSMQATDPGSWTADAKEIFHNAIEWAAPEPPVNGPHFAPYDLAVTPATVAVGEPVSVSVRVKNVGSSSGTYDAELKVGGSTFATTPVTLAAGASTTVSWTITPDAVGTYRVTVGYLAGSFRVQTAG